MTLIAGLAATVAAHIGVLLTTYGLFRKTGDTRSDILWFCILRWGVMSAIVILMGLFGTMTAVSLSVLSVGAGILTMALKRKELVSDFEAGRQWCVNRLVERRAMDSDLRTAVSIGAVLAGLLALRTLLAVWFYTPYSNDSTNYHLPKLALWVQTGSIGREPFDDLRSFMPGGFQLIQVWWVAFLHHDLLIEMAGVEFLAFGGMVIYILSRDLGMSRLQGGLAALLFGSLPVMMAQSTSCMNDLAVGALTLAALRFALRNGPRWHDVSMALAAIATAMAIKPTAVYAVPVIGFCFLGKKERDSKGGVDPLRVVTLLIPVLASVYWYLINALEFGNPIYPAGIEIAGWRPFNEAAGVMLVRDLYAGHQTGFSASSLGLNVSEFLQYRLYDAFSPYSHESLKQVGWGWCGMAIGMPALILVVRRGMIPAKVLFAFVASFLLTLGTLKMDVWNMRFVAWCAALPCMAVPIVLPSIGPVARRGVLYLLLFGTAMNLVGITSIDRLVPNNYRKSIAGSWDTRNYTAFGSGGAFLNEPRRGEPVLFMGVAYPLYALYGSDFHRRVIPLASSVDLEHAMDQSGARYLILGTIMPPCERRRIDLYVEAGYLVKMDEYCYVRRAP